jgi:hypothetical protein
MSQDQSRGFSYGNQSRMSKSPTLESPGEHSMGATTKPPMNSSASGATSGAQTGVVSGAPEVQQSIEQAVDRVRERGKSQLAAEKDRVAGTVGSVAQALRATGKQLQQGDDPAVAEYVDRVADSVEEFSNHLRRRNVDELVGDTERFARHQPAMFLGGAFFLGLVAARFLKSSRPEPSPVISSSQRVAGVPTATSWPRSS